MGSSHSVPKEGGERLSDYLRREFKGKGFDADTLVVIALKDEQKQQQKDKKKRKGLWKQLTGRLSSKRSADKHDKNTKGNPAAKTTSAECNTQSAIKIPESKTEREDVETPPSNTNVVNSGSPEETSVHLDTGTTSGPSETHAATQNVEPTPSTSSNIERRYLQDGDSPVYQFNVPPKFDFSQSGIRNVRDMTRGTQPSWADKDYGSEPWEDNTDNHTEEMSQDHSSQTNEISRNSSQHVGGWSDQTAYRVRGLAEELANLAFKLSADANRLVEDRNDGPTSSVVSDAQKAACCSKNKIIDPATIVENIVQESSCNDKSRHDTSANILSSQEAEHAAVSQEASCQTENMAQETKCVDVMQEGDPRDNVSRKLKDNGQLADTKPNNENSVENKAEDAVSATSEMATYSVNQNDKELAYIAGILAAGAAYHVGNRSDVQKAAYLAGVRAVDAAYRRANETASSFADIRLAESTNTVKSEVEAETAAYLAGIRAVEVAHRKAEEKAYMNGIKDAKEVISTKGKVEEPVSKGKVTDTSIWPEENLDKATILSKTNTNQMQQEYTSKPLRAEMPLKDSENEKLDNEYVANEKAQGNRNCLANRIDNKEVISDEDITHAANLTNGEKKKSSVKMLENIEDTCNGFDQSFLKEDTHRSDKMVIKEADMPRCQKEINQNNIENASENKSCNVTNKLSKVVNKKIGSDNDRSGHVEKEENCESQEETIVSSGFGDSNKDDNDKSNTSFLSSELNDTDELLFDRGEEITDIKELERMYELIFQRFAPSAESDKNEESKEKDILEDLKIDETTKDNSQGTSAKTVKPFIDMATFDEMPIKKPNRLLRQSWAEGENTSEGFCSSEKKNASTTKKNTDKHSKLKCDTKCKPQPQKTERDCDKSDKSQMKTAMQKQDDKAEAFYVSFDSQTANTETIKDDEKENQQNTPVVTGKPFIDMATFDEMPIKKAEALLRPPGEETEFAPPDHLTKQNSNTVTDSINVNNDKKPDTSDSNYINETDTHSKNGAAEAFFVSFDAPAVDNGPKKRAKKDIPDTSNHEDRPFIDMATFDDMPIKKADALLRPFGNEDEYKSGGNDTISGKIDSVKTKVKRLVRKKGQYGTLAHNKSIENENAMKNKKMECASAKVDSLNTQSKNGAADAFFVSFDPPAVDKSCKKRAKKDIPDTSNNEDRPFIDMATFDDMPIKKADALLRPFGNEDEYKSGRNDTISGKIDSVKTKVKRLVRKKGQYGTLAHNKLIENENAMRKEKMESSPATADSFKTSDDDDNSDTKIIKRPQKLIAKKAQYGSVAHNNQIKEGNEIQKKKLNSIKSSLDTWKTKEEEVPKKRAQYGSVAHNNQIKLDNAMRKRRMEEIHSNLDTWNAPNPGSKYSLQRKAEWEPVSDPGKYGSVAHFQQIKSNNAKRKKRMNNIQSSLDTWNKPNPGSMYSLKRKDEWAPVSDARKYGSVAHYHQVKQTQGNNKRLIKGAGSRISTWQSKNKMNLLHANNQKGTGGKTLSTYNKVSVSNTDYNTERNDFSQRKNDHKLSSWSRYGSQARTREYEDDQGDVSYGCPREKTYQHYDKYPSPNSRHSQYRNGNNDKSSFTYKGMQQKQSKIPRLVKPNNEEGLASSRSKVPKSLLAFEGNHGNRYREVNPLTIDLGGKHWDNDYSNWQFKDSARSCSRPVSCRSDGSSFIPVIQEELLGTYAGKLHVDTPRTNNWRHQSMTRWSPRGYD